MPDTAAIAALSRRRLTMSDGAELSLIDVGWGPAMIILPSWTNSAAQYHHQVTEFAADHRVIAVDVRAGGLSAKIDFGLRISRFSADLREICAQLAIAPTILMGHSMGCSIIWSYLDLFGPREVDALILVDQAPTQLIQPRWSADEALSYGATQTAEDVFAFAARFAAPDGVDWTWRRYRPLFTKTFPVDEFDWAVRESLQMPRNARREALPRSCHAGLARCHPPHPAPDIGRRRREERVSGGLAGVDCASDTGRAPRDLRREGRRVAFHVL
jgi:pimeloyl-ACP methyl ester carboxylesterase